MKLFPWKSCKFYGALNLFGCCCQTNEVEWVRAAVLEAEVSQEPELPARLLRYESVTQGLAPALVWHRSLA